MIIQAHREPQWGLGKHSRGTPQTFLRGPSGEKFNKNSFYNAALMCILYF